jgi:ABC-2 type transport system ATP-binding protein
VDPTSSGPDWIRYRTQDPVQANPLVLQILAAQGLPVITLQEAPRSLEQVYLQAISVADPDEVLHVE